MDAFLAAVSYNQPQLSRQACWNADALTVINATQAAYHPVSIFVSTNNTLYISKEGYTNVLVWLEGGISSTRVIYGGYGLFVTDNEDVYVFDDGNKQVSRWSVNATGSQIVMFNSAYCGGLFVDMNSTLYCAATGMHQV